jgi:hypothetical protein
LLDTVTGKFSGISTVAEIDKPFIALNIINPVRNDYAIS